jgi:hypothetical protein
MPSYPLVEMLVGALADWWRKHQSLTPRVTMENTFSAAELARLAEDMRVPEHMLRAVLQHYPELSNLMARRKAALLWRRMAALHLGAPELARTTSAGLREMAHKCAACADQDRCESDLLRDPQDPAWTRYCPNAAALTSLH